VTFDPIATAAVTAATGPATLAAPSSTISFAPGSVVAGRYRLVALLGRGGMGDVYRADDLTLDQPVALKFLPAGVTADDDRLSRFHNELRIARQVSHRNVCRVYDLGEVHGRRFLTMEYVDGEDLGSLLRRIGRVPQDKALDLARQLCAGVAAAHDRGVLHCDLKPANIMIDGQGNVRITDFGIATVIDAADRGFAGTPQYMAPEQFDGRPASVKSDIYALGLVLFELCTGRRAVESRTLAELKDFHRTGTIATPSSLVRDLDPAIERIILRCLERDPDRRPASALVVAAALPGADPLAAALAAGETPSPELLAAAGESEAIRLRAGMPLVLLTLVGLLVFWAWSSRVSVAGRAPLDLPPAVLADRAERIVESLGYPLATGASARGFTRASAYTQWLFQTRRTPDRWDPVATGETPAVLFWHRSAARALLPVAGSRVTLDDPPSTFTDMRTVILDGRGRLQEFRAVPPQFEDSTEQPPPVNWASAFAAAGLDPATFTRVAPAWSPRDYADERAAWEGPLPGPSNVSIRVEAASYRGRPVWFAVVGPWTRPTLMSARGQSLVDRVIRVVLTLFVVGLFAIGGLLARHNLRAGRADRRGAARLAVAVALVGLAGWLASASHQTDLVAEDTLLFDGVGTALLMSALIWMLYVALEPHVRRLWPDSLLGWSRLLAGHIRDPRVGRDLLVGMAAGTLTGLLQVGRASIIPWLGHPAPSPTFGRGVELLAGPGMLVSGWTDAITRTVEMSLLLVLLIVLVRLALRRMWLVVPIAIVIFGIPAMNEAGTTTASLVAMFAVATGALLTLVLFRFGVLSFATAWLVWTVVTNVPMMPDPSHWSAAAGTWTIVTLSMLTCFAFYAARAGQPLLGALLKD
jgi:serine/threonine-protein kinase